MNVALNVIAIILSLVLLVFLILGIVVLMGMYRATKKINQLEDKTITMAENLKSFVDVSMSSALAKGFVSAVLDHAKKRSKVKVKK